MDENESPVLIDANCIIFIFVQRGRDHGLAGYTKYKKSCEGLTWTARDFDDLLDRNLMHKRHVDTLKQGKSFSSLLHKEK